MTTPLILAALYATVALLLAAHFAREAVARGTLRRDWRYVAIFSVALWLPIALWAPFIWLEENRLWKRA